MIRPQRDWKSGRLVRLDHDSQELRDNIWNDPSRRQVLAYLPAEADAHPDRKFPVIWYLAAFTNSGGSIANWRGFSENLCERLDRLIGTGAMGPVVVVAPDCFSTLGGSQYVDSPMVARHASYIHNELLGFAEQTLPILPGRAHRAVVGKSSGGYGALRFGMHHADSWAAIASHSGDAHFDALFRGDFATAAQTLARYRGEPRAFLEAFWQDNAPSGSDFHTLMFLCMAASYDPSADQEIRLPFDLHTLELDNDAWKRWQSFDPIVELDRSLESLKSLAGIFIDVGNKDQYNIHFGSRILHRKLSEAGIAHHYEEFDGTHSNIDHRLDVSLPYLYEHIQ